MLSEYPPLFNDCNVTQLAVIPRIATVTAHTILVCGNAGCLMTSE